MSDLELCFGAWHGHCNRDCQNEKTFESSEWSKRFSLETTGKPMKPTTITNKNARKFPFVDYDYQASTLGNFTGSCAKTSSKSLRDISRANHDFLSDAAVFGTLIATAAVPIIAGLSAVVELCRALPF